MRAKKIILSCLFLIHLFFALANPPSCFEILANDLTNTQTTQAFKDFVKQPEGFLAFQKLSDKAYDIRTNIELLNLSKKLEGQPATFSKILSEIGDAEILDFAKEFQNKSLTDLSKFDADNTLFSVWKSFKHSKINVISDPIAVLGMRNNLDILQELSKINKSLGQNALELEVLKKIEIYDNTAASEILFYFQNINKVLTITPKPKQLIYLAIPEVGQSGSRLVGFNVKAGKFEFDDINDLLDLQDIKDELLYFKDDKFIGGVFDFVIDYKGSLKIGNAHSSLAGTAPVQAVGEILIKDGKILEFCNASGHIKPELLKSTIYKELLNDKLLDVQDVKEILIDFSDIEAANILNSQKNTRWQSIIDGWKVSGAGKVGLLSKLDNFTNLKKWVNSLDDIADAGLISKLDNYITANPTKLQKFEGVLNAPVLKNQEWDNLEKVFDAFKKAESKGVSVGHKKFPTVDDEGSGSFVLKNAKQYQAEASGDAALSLEKAGTSWDNIDDAGKLIDRKYGHGNSVFNEIDDGFGGKIISVKNQTRANSIIEQATRQINAAGGTPIKWEISTELGAKGIRKLFDESDNILLKNIEVVFVPQIKIIP